VILQGPDSFVLVPLFASAILIAAIIVFLFITAIRKTAKISFVFFLALACVLVGAVYTAMHQNLMYFALMIFLAALLILPYAVVKALAKSEEKDDGKKILIKGGKRINVVYDDEDRSIMDIQKDLLSHAISAISVPGGMDQILDYYCKQAIELARADGSMILMLDDFEDLVSVKHLEGVFVPPYALPENIPHKQNRIDMSMKYAQFKLDENIFGHILMESKAELITEPHKDERIHENKNEDFLKCGSYIFVPLIAQSTKLGEIALSRNHDNDLFTEEEFNSVKKIADIMALGIHSIIVHNDMIERSNTEKESEIASRIQKSLIPAKMPLLPGITTGAFFTAAESICGDYYDLLVARKDRIAFVLGDVTGKNLTAMVIMIQIRAMLRLVINTTQTPATILNWVNRGLNFEEDTDHFASVSLLFYDSISKKIHYSSGGTNPIYLYKASDSSFVKISDDSEPVGMEKETVYKDKEISPETGDIIITCSDGLIEARNLDGKQYTAARLEKTIKANASLTGKDIVNKVKEDLNSFCGSAVQHDDNSLLVIKIQ